LLGRLPESPCRNDIIKDINRTFPTHEYFSNDAQGANGQA